MTRIITQTIRSFMLTSLLVGASLTLWHCSGKKQESTTDTATTTADSSVMGRQGDTLNSSSMDAPQQAPADSGSVQGATVPAEVKVRAKRQ